MRLLVLRREVVCYMRRCHGIDLDVYEAMNFACCEVCIRSKDSVHEVFMKTAPRFDGSSTIVEKTPLLISQRPWKAIVIC